jgi:hypothetical protein
MGYLACGLKLDEILIFLVQTFLRADNISQVTGVLL